MATTKRAIKAATPTVKTGGALRPAVNIADDMAAAIIEEIGLMARQTRREMLAALSRSCDG